MFGAWRYQESRPNLNVYEFYYALARLGGHQNRKHDPPPGWLVLWRGWTQLQAMVDGVRAVGGDIGSGKLKAQAPGSSSLTLTRSLTFRARIIRYREEET